MTYIMLPSSRHTIAMSTLGYLPSLVNSVMFSSASLRPFNELGHLSHFRCITDHILAPEFPTAWVPILQQSW